MRKAKGHKSFDFKIGMKVVVKNNKKQGRKGSWLEEDWLGPYDTPSILDNSVQITTNGKLLQNKTALIHIKLYKSLSRYCTGACTTLWPNAAAISCRECFCCLCLSRIHGIWGGAWRGHSPVTDHAGVRQQPEVLLCKGLHHITPLDVLLCEGSHHITPLPLTTVSKECISESSAYGEKPGEDTSPATDHAGVRQQPEVLLCEGSQHITPLPLTTVGKECISGVPNPSRPE
ncbi:uncharacterized protein LOC135096695 isoform X1 [Scylla paramamosain]|uniref:uncharacterized protein LOC135096695 isoform X1 n=1 Tax=Scylla paramamosain TaxID=85552 RepID=UPI003083A696